MRSGVSESGVFYARQADATGRQADREAEVDITQTPLWYFGHRPNLMTLINGIFRIPGISGGIDV